MPSNADDAFFDDGRPRGRYGPRQQRARARAACEGCLAARHCLELALRYERESGVSWGYWGGKAPDERRSIIDRREHVDDIATDVLRVLVEACGEEAELDALPARVRTRLVVLGLVLVHSLREDEYLLPQMAAAHAVTARPEAHYRSAPRVALAPAG